MYTIDDREVDLAALLARRTHVRDETRAIALDNAIGVPDRIDHALASTDIDQLSYSRNSGRLDLKQRIFGETCQGDAFHLRIEAGEASKLVEQQAAPEPFVRVTRQLVLVCAEHQTCPRAMLVEVFFDDAILQHAAE